MRYQEILEACWKGYRQAGMKKKGDRQVPNCVPVSENEVRNDADNFSPNDNALDRLHHEFIPTWQILNHKVLKTAYNFSDDDTALEFVQAIKLMGERMDHNGVITLDNAQVTVEVTTHDVNGLTRLDFEYALKAQDLANKMNGDQEPHPTNSLQAIEEDLKKWFKEKWVRFGPDGKIRGDCARGSSKEGKPKCLPQSKAHALGKKGRASAAAKKRREDPNAERRGAAKNVATRVKEDDLDEACWKGYHKEGMKTMFGKRYPNCVKNEDASDSTDSGPNILELLRSWRNRVPAKYAWHLTKTFGDPHDATEDLVIWHDRDGFKRIEIKDEYVMHISPSPHYDYCYSYIDLQVPHRLSSALANCSESILIDHLKNEVGARCASLAANAVTLNFVMDVVAGRTRPSPDEYEQRIMDMHDDFENGKIFSIAWWPDQSHDTDPANPYYAKQQKSRTQDKVMQEQQCPECGGAMYPETMINEKQDACYHKVKSRYKVWPSAYASGALVQCRKKGAANWGNKKK